MSRVALLCLTFAAAAAGAQVAENAAPAPVEKNICRTITPTGTIMGTRVCQTRAKWSAWDGAWEDRKSHSRKSMAIETQQGSGNLIVP